jgi:hypothetical protein
LDILNYMNKENTLLFIDWDDTLLFSSWLVKNKINVSSLDDEYLGHFYKLDKQLELLFRTIIKYSNVIIVTNAMPEWIDMTIQLLPRTNNIIKDIKIVSARNEYQKKSKNIYEWKIKAFEKEMDDFVEKNKKNLLNIISVGDAEYEYNALIKLGKYKPHIKKLLKSVKFMTNPDCEILLKQIELLCEATPEIVTKNENLDLIFSGC